MTDIAISGVRLVMARIAINFGLEDADRCLTSILDFRVLEKMKIRGENQQN